MALTLAEELDQKATEAENDRAITVKSWNAAFAKYQEQTKEFTKLSNQVKEARQILNTCQYESWESFDAVINRLKSVLENTSNRPEEAKPE
jgi:hypothetical protein